MIVWVGGLIILDVDVDVGWVGGVMRADRWRVGGLVLWVMKGSC